MVKIEGKLVCDICDIQVDILYNSEALDLCVDCFIFKKKQQNKLTKSEESILKERDAIITQVFRKRGLR